MLTVEYVEFQASTNYYKKTAQKRNHRVVVELVLKILSLTTLGSLNFAHIIMILSTPSASTMLSVSL
jgi:hypothetical protein